MPMGRRTISSSSTSSKVPRPHTTAGAAAVAGLAVDFNPALMLFDDAVDGGQAEAGALAHFLGGEERFKNALERAVIHAAAGVGHGQHDKLAGPELGVQLHRLVVQFHRAGADG